MRILNKGIEDKKRNEYFDKMMHDNDVSVMRNKKVETDMIQRGLNDRQKEDKAMLGQIYQNQIDQARRMKENEQMIEKQLERMQIEKLQGIDPDAYNKLKKQAYQNELRQELDQKNKMKQYDQLLREHSVRESKKLMDDYAQKEMVNEQNYRNKFQKFDNGMQQRLSNYNNFVMKPQLEKNQSLDMIERKNIAEYNRKQAENEMIQEAKRKQQMLAASNQLKVQMNEKNKMSRLNNELGQIEVNRTSDRVNEIKNFDQMLKEDKKKRQDMYRQMLNSQIQYNNGLKSFGNMTKVEKMMNRDDLRAYKRFDNNQYSMIPGISPEKKFVPSSASKPLKKLDHSEEQRRLEAFGYGRYMKKVPSAGPIENYNSFNDMSRSYTGNNQTTQNPYNIKDGQGVPISRRHQMSPRSPHALRNAGAHSMAQEL